MGFQFQVHGWTEKIARMEHKKQHLLETRDSVRIKLNSLLI
jgi:hypothetical protein